MNEPQLTACATAVRMLRALTEAADTYAQCPLGKIAARWVRWLRLERGATASTIRDYEGVIGRVVVMLDTMELTALEQVTIDDLRLVIDALWGDREPRTRAKVTSVIRSFFEWTLDERYIDVSPAARIRRPKAPQKAIPLLPDATRDRMLGAAPTARDVLALTVLHDLGLRRNELRLLQVRDLDLARRVLVVTSGKGGKVRTLPLRGEIILAAEGYLLDNLEGVGRQPLPDDYLLYPAKRMPDGRVEHADPSRPMAPNGVHRWWYRMCVAAGLVEKGETSGLHMHRARHGFAMEMRRAVSLEAASKALGHSDLSTTMRAYGHYQDDELASAFDALERSRRERT